MTETTDQEKILDLTCNYAYIRGIFRGRLQMIKALAEAGCASRVEKECGDALEWLDKLEAPNKD